MSITIGTATVINPIYDGGWSRRRERIGGDWLFADGSRGRHCLTAQWHYRMTWHVLGDDYTDLMQALLAVECSVFTLTDHLGNGGACQLAGDPEETQINNSVHEVSAEFVEVTGTEGGS